MGKRIKAEKRVQARRSDVIPSGGKPDKPKEESKGIKRMSGRSQAPKVNEAMAGCNGNPFKQWHRDKHSQSLIACVHSVHG